MADEVLHQRVDDVGVDLRRLHAVALEGEDMALVAIAGISDLDDPEAPARLTERNGNSLRSIYNKRGNKNGLGPGDGSGSRAGILHRAARLRHEVHRDHRLAIPRYEVLRPWNPGE